MRTVLNPLVRKGAFLPGILLVPFLLGVPGLPGGVDEADPSVGAADLPAPAVSLPIPPLPEEPVRAGSGGVETFEPRPAPFPLRVDGREIRFEVQAVSVLAGETLVVEAPVEAVLLEPTGAVPADTGGRWRWTAPGSAGVVPLRIHTPQGEVDLNVLVMRPMDDVRNGVLNGYPIGRYVGDPGDPNPLHRPPVGFVEVGPADEDILISPHFTLGQFLCKEPGDPRYIVLTDPLLVKLEAILAAVNESGITAPTLHIMSGYRTPAYNRAIGNTTDRSRHLWGDAADIFIDTTGDGMMDDLNGDGRVDDADARILMEIIEKVDRSGAPGVNPGGLSLYRTRPGRGPFIHVDARGTPTRW